MKTIQDELREWMRPMSPLTAFAKSVRNEQGAGQDDASKATKVEYIDPLADFDFDELPADQKTRLLKLQSDFKAQHEKTTELETRRTKAEEFARTQQSRADKLQRVVQSHNLPVDGVQPNVAPNSADAKTATLEAQFLKDGLPEAQAKAYAKMFATANALERESLMRELGPLAGAVGNIQANQVLANAQTVYSQVFAVPELAKQIQDNVAILVNKGDVVNDKTLEHLVGMAWGHYALHNPDAITKSVKTQQQQQVPSFRGGLPAGGGHVSNANVAADGAPIATQPETLTIMANINKFLTADMPQKKK